MQFKKTINTQFKKQVTHLGFTIVELLIVIVVIGILATLAIVAYNRTIQNSHVASLQSDLGTAAGQLNLDNGSNGTYPASAALANNGAGLKPSAGTTFTYVYTSSDNSYCLIGTKNGASYYVAEGTDNPVAGTACPPRVTTLAGSGAAGFADGTGSIAQLSGPTSVAVNSSGTIYVADSSNNRIRKITSGGVVTTLAGSGVAGSTDGVGSAAQFSHPVGLAVDASDTVFVADPGNNRIRKITSGGVVTTLAGSTYGFADGAGSAAQFRNPRGVALDSSGTAYVTDSDNNCIRKISPAGVVTTLAGSSVTYGFADGTGSAAQFAFPWGVAVDSSGTIYVADYDYSLIRKITSAGVVTTLAGSTLGGYGVYGFADGTGGDAQFYYPTGMAIDSSGSIYVADRANGRIRKITSAGVVTTVAGNGGNGFADGAVNTAQFAAPYGVAVDSSGTIYVGDTFNNRIRKVR